MGVLFLSHSSRDNETAIRICEWLKENGWSGTFLDLDPEHGLAPGHRWQQELKEAGERCSGVIVLISPNWLASEWCRTEFLVADQLGKKIFPVLIAATKREGVIRDLASRFQFADISSPEKEAEGLQRLALGLKRAGLSPNSFPWPPRGDTHRPIYRGLEALEEQDAAIYFGRDAPITKALDTLRRMRGGAPERILVILGASGAGKSSFLRAGLIARLKRDEENFVVLPVIRPERAALTGSQGFAASLGCEAAQLTDCSDVQKTLDRMRNSATTRLRRFTGSEESGSGRSPVAVIAIDQAEEFFTAENAEAPAVLDLLRDTLQHDRDAIAIMTIRPDSFVRLQEQFAEVPLQPFNLPPIPIGAFKEVIECPARLARPPLAIESALVDRLLQDLAAEDALPLLALTLERLFLNHRGGGTLTLAEYVEKLGGLRGAIVGAVEAAFSESQRDSAMPQSHGELEKLARAAFIPALVNLDGPNAEPRRRVERFSALPENARPLVRHLINQRLLVSNRSVIDGEETDTVEIAHEAILRQWPALRAWIAAERDALRTLESVRAAAAEWQRHRQDDVSAQGRSWLTHRGSRLQEAEALLARADFAAAFDATGRNYLAACRQCEDDEIEREQHALIRTRRLQRRIGVIIAIAAVLVFVAGVGLVQLFAGVSTASANVLAGPTTKAAAESNYELSARYALAWLAAAKWAHGGTEDAVSALRFAISASSTIAVLRGHASQVLSASFSPDGKEIVTASRDGTGRLWDVATARTIAVLSGHQGALLSAIFDHEGRRIVTSSEDRTTRVWDARTTTQLVTVKTPAGTAYSAVFSPDGEKILTASADQTARIWDARSGAPLAVLQGHEGEVETGNFSPDGQRAVTGSDDRTACIWDVNSGRRLAVLKGHESIVESAVFSPDGRLVATASDDKTVRLWDAQSGRVLKVLRGHENAVQSVAFNSDGSRIVSGAKDGTVRIWDVGSGAEISVLKGHEGGVNSVAFSADGNRVVSASDDGTARIWDAKPHVIVMRGHDDQVNGVAFSPDGTRIATASNDKTLRIWDARTGSALAMLQGHSDLVEAVAFSPNGARVISGSDDRTLRVWETNSGRLLATLRPGGNAVYGVAFSPDGKRIAAASTDAKVRILDARTGNVLAVLRGHARVVNTVEFSKDGRYLVTSSRDGTARLWDVDSGQTLRTFSEQASGNRLYTAGFSPNGKQIVTAGQDGTVRTWDAATGQSLLVLPGHDDRVMGASFSPDGKRIITASHDRTVRIWDAVTGSPIAVLRGHVGAIEALAVSPDGRWALTGSDDNTARLWDISRMLPSSPDNLVRLACDNGLARGLSQFSAEEMHAVPVLDPKLDRDACRAPGVWSRLERIFLGGRSE